MFKEYDFGFVKEKTYAVKSSETIAINLGNK